MLSAYLWMLPAVAVSAIAAVYDLRSWRIPNWLSLGALGTAPLVHFIWGAATQGLQAGLAALGWSLAGAAICAVVPFLCWRSGTFGGGDVKLLAALGALCLPKVGVTIEFDAMVVGVIFAFGRLAWDGKLFRTLGNTVALAVNPLLPKAKRRAVPAETMTPMRFAPAILGGVLVCALFQPR